MTEISGAETPYPFDPSMEGVVREMATLRGLDPDQVVRDAGRIMKYLEPALEAQLAKPLEPKE